MRGLEYRLPSGLKILVPLLLILWTSAEHADGENFAFAGISRATTLQELKQRYPNSSIMGNYVYVSAVDSHDHIYGIEIPGFRSGGRLRLSFERPRELSRDGRPRYPSCQPIISALQARYGTPARVEEFSEERSWNRRLSWTRGSEALSLHCFRIEQGAFLAEALTITADR